MSKVSLLTEQLPHPFLFYASKEINDSITFTKLISNLSENVIVYHIRTFSPESNTVIIFLRKTYLKRKEC